MFVVRLKGIRDRNVVEKLTRLDLSVPADRLPELKRRLRLYAEEHLADRVPEQLIRIHAELPLDRITTVLAGFLTFLIYAIRKSEALTAAAENAAKQAQAEAPPGC